MRELLNYNLIVISEQLTTEQIIYARRFRNWNKFDKLDEINKLRYRIEELKYYEDDIDPEYQPKSFI
jgi:hypothetical protein